MRKITLALAFQLAALAAFSQTDKGDWMVGGTLRLNTADKNTQINFAPGAAAFIVHNLAIGGNLSFDYSKVGDTKTTAFGIGPLARYYFGTAQVRPIIQGTLNFLSSKTKLMNVSNSNTGLNYFLGGGAAIFISDQVSIDGLIGYDHTKYKDFDGSGGLALTVGFQVYLLKGQVDKVRGR